MASKRLAFLGPPGTFTEEAALVYQRGVELVPCRSISEVAEVVSSRAAPKGIVPIENSLEGSVNETLDVLISYRVQICGEVILPIRHCLLTPSGVRWQEVEVVYSHPQALGQCRNFLAKYLPKAVSVATLSTVAAVEEMLKSKVPAAAIGTKRAAQLWGGYVACENIQDHSYNVSRFVVLALKGHPPTGDDKTSICFSFAEDRPGLLYGVLGEFASRNINLTKIESRPMKELLGRYYFLVDCQGHQEEVVVKEALRAVRSRTSFFKIFGSYPRYRG